MINYILVDRDNKATSSAKPDLCMVFKISYYDYYQYFLHLVYFNSRNVFFF
jgi:hypothetical protein